MKCPRDKEVETIEEEGNLPDKEWQPKPTEPIEFKNENKKNKEGHNLRDHSQQTKTDKSQQGSNTSKTSSKKEANKKLWTVASESKKYSSNVSSNPWSNKLVDYFFIIDHIHTPST